MGSLLMWQNMNGQQAMNASENREPLTLQQAAGVAGVSPDTVARWCKRYGIGKQLHWKAPWRVDPVGLAIIAAGDGAALEEYRHGCSDENERWDSHAG